jgi:hypothetical protein
VSEAEQRNALENKLQEVVLDHASKDEVIWALDKSKNYATKSLYRFTTHRGMDVANAKSIWKTKLPLKIQIFLWQLSSNKLQTVTNIKKGRGRVVLSAACVGKKKILITFSLDAL